MGSLRVCMVALMLTKPKLGCVKLGCVKLGCVEPEYRPMCVPEGGPIKEQKSAHAQFTCGAARGMQVGGLRVGGVLAPLKPCTVHL